MRLKICSRSQRRIDRRAALATIRAERRSAPLLPSIGPAAPPALRDRLLRCYRQFFEKDESRFDDAAGGLMAATHGVPWPSLRLRSGQALAMLEHGLEARGTPLGPAALARAERRSARPAGDGMPSPNDARCRASAAFFAARDTLRRYYVYRWIDLGREEQMLDDAEGGRAGASSGPPPGERDTHYASTFIGSFCQRMKENLTTGPGAVALALTVNCKLSTSSHLIPYPAAGNHAKIGQRPEERIPCWVGKKWS